MARQTRYSQRRRRRKTKQTRTKAIFALLLLAAMVIALFYGCQRVTGAMRAQADLFMARVSEGDRDGANVISEVEGTALLGLIDLFQEPAVVYIGPGAARLTGPAEGLVEFKFRVRNHDFIASVLLFRQGWEWRVRAVPEIRTISGAYVEAKQPGQLSLLWEEEALVVRTSGTSDFAAGAVIKARLVDDIAVMVDPLDQVHLSRLLRRDSAELEGEYEGVFKLRRPLFVYRLEQDAVSAGSPADLLINSVLALYLDGGEVAAVKVAGRPAPGTIRVVLRQNLHNLSNETLRHRWLSLRGETGFTLEDRVDNLSFTFEAGRTLSIEPAPEGIRVTPDDSGNLIFTNRIFLTPAEDGSLFITNLPRGGWTDTDPAYQGVLEIANQDGALLVVNEPTLEQYLYTVIPSEMPLSFGPEPLKAQSVAARSYAYTSLFSSRFSGYGAHVDDSVLSQVYNNYPQDPRSVEAVDSTAGLVLFYNGAIADTRFFSTSGGYTANYHEVWQDTATGRFPAEPRVYLQAACQIPGQTVSLQTEAQVCEFILRSDWPAYDREAPFFRWRVEMTAAELEASINHNLGPRHAEQPDFVLTGQDGEFHSIEIPRNPLGSLLDIRVVRRGEGGNIMELEVEGTNGTYRIIKEYNIRFTLRPVQYLDGAPVVLARHDGSRLENYTILPSTFACFEQVRDAGGGLARIIITGGGNGHGVGMSQYGARGMAMQGSSFKEILAHFYPGTEPATLY